MLLAIDTSGAETSVALVSPDSRRDKTTVTESLTEEKAMQQISSTQGISTEQCNSPEKVRSHSSSLSLQVRSLLSAHGCGVSALSAIVLGSGPGSFTGLRIGYAFAKGLAQAANIPIFTLSSLAAAAWKHRHRASNILALDDARRGEFFASAYSLDQGLLVSKLPEQIISVEDVKNWKESNIECALVTANPIVKKSFPETFLVDSLALSLAQQLETTVSRVAASNVLELADLSPFYLRKVAALTIEERLGSLK